ncbi:SMP-30/gluconolactonase/LRE family protein [Rhizobium bangladeshense]|uniref:SMP-30/gluconolactonase/LRE family protein n=1 Tax=Rhizobium bangladeshense TaxID=1138189 RepID=UPI0009EE6B13|nr:SMP-30/gluconolactonase/LRE family protein [Rhizobium bangladeshense]
MIDRIPVRRFVAERVAEPGCRLAESPVWDGASGCLHWVDITARHFYRMPVAEMRWERLDLETAVGAFALREDGGFIAGTDRGFARLDLQGGKVELSFGIGPCLRANWRLNDAACDRQGRFWSGSLSQTPADPSTAGQLYSLENEELVVSRGGVFRVQNGLAWSPDGLRMYVSDSHVSGPAVTAFDFDPVTGERSNPILFADHGTLGGRPDGAAMDVDGCYWIAASDSGRVLRITPSGRIDASIEVDTPNPTNICFGGADLRTAFITSLQRDGRPEACIYAIHLPFQGLEEPRYRP